MTGSLPFSMRVQVGAQQLANLAQAMSLSHHAYQLQVFDADEQPVGQLQLCGSTVVQARHQGETGAEAFVRLMLDPTVARVDAYLDEPPAVEVSVGPLESLLLLTLARTPHPTDEPTLIPTAADHARVGPLAGQPAVLHEPTTSVGASALGAPERLAPAAEQTPRPKTRPARRGRVDVWTAVLVLAILLILLLLANSVLHFL